MNLVFEPSPLPWSLLLCWLAVPGIWLGAATLTAILTTDRVVQQLFNYGLAIAAGIVAVQLASVATRSFWVGLPAGLIAASLMGAKLWREQRRQAMARPERPKPPLDARFPRAMWMTMAAQRRSGSRFRGHFHDMLLPNGHMALSRRFPKQLFSA